MCSSVGLEVKVDGFRINTKRGLNSCGHSIDAGHTYDAVKSGHVVASCTKTIWVPKGSILSILSTMEVVVD